MKNLLKNSSWIFVSQIIVKGISFFYTIFLASKLGIEGFGLYSAALAYFSLFSSISDFGLSRYLIREGSRDNERLNKLLTQTIILRLFLIFILLGIVIIFLQMYDSDANRRALSILAILAVIPQAVALTFDGVLVALQKLKLSSIGVLVLSIFTVLIGFILVSYGYGETGALSALMIAEILYAILMCFFVVNTKIHFPYSKKLFTEIKPVLKGSLPYGILGIIGLIYFKIDTLLLSYLKGSYDTGIYSAGYRFLEALVFIPSALSTAAFPVLSRLHDNDNAQIKRIYFSSLKLLGGVSLLITVLYLFLLPVFLPIVLPKYSGSIDVIKILALTIPFMFIHVPGAAVLLSSDKLLKPVIYLSFLTVSFNIISNLIFIPIYGVYASAWITVFSEMLSFVVFFILLYKKILKDA